MSPNYKSVLEAMAEALQASGDYRVLRRLDPHSFIKPRDGSKTHLGLFLDVETTGLDSWRDEVIELALVPFIFSDDGKIFDVLDKFQSFQQPSEPISPKITELTG